MLLNSQLLNSQLLNSQLLNSQLLNSQHFTEVNFIAQEADLDYVQGYPDVALTSAALTPAALTMDERLDDSSLRTVLSMLAVLAVEELALLETLTPAQKRQVWDATPEPVRARLKRLRAAAEQGQGGTEDAGLSAPNEAIWAKADLTEENSTEENSEEAQTEEAQTEEAQTEEASETALGVFPSQNLSVVQLTPLSPGLSSPGLSSSGLPSSRLPQAGDWVVLQAQPQLTAAELTAIWEVIDIQDNQVEVFAQKLGTHTYPITWVILYPKPSGYVEPEF